MFVYLSTSSYLYGRVSCAFGQVGGTVLTCELALRYGLACNLAGGTHHAHRSFGSGYVKRKVSLPANVPVYSRVCCNAHDTFDDSMEIELYEVPGL
jgi:hypothetical protein